MDGRGDCSLLVAVLDGMDLLNSYAIVAYLGGPVARFADDLRREMAPSSCEQTHITVLPPRPIYSTIPEAIEFARQLVSQFEPFDVRPGSIQKFPNTQVVYISLVSGVCELAAMHDVLNTGFFGQEELYPYVPHITLGRELPASSFERCVELSVERWQQFGPAPLLRVETLTFVRQRADGSWANLGELALGSVPTIG